MANGHLFRELEALRREIDAAFNGFGVNRQFFSPFVGGAGQRRFPLVNLSEDENAVYLEALVPGVEPQQLEMTVLRNTITIAGDRKGPEERRGEVMHRSERAFGKFSRTLELPMEVDPENVQAVCKDGLLTVTMHKSPAAKPRKISVAVS